jgi:hypothetical protein
MGLSALFSQSPHISKSVRNFSVYPGNATGKACSACVLFAIIPDLVAALDKYGIIDLMIWLQTLRICAIAAISQVSEGMLSVLSRPQDIRHVHLQSTKIPSFDTLLSFFPSLSSIRLEGVDFFRNSTIVQDSGLDTVFFRKPSLPREASLLPSLELLAASPLHSELGVLATSRLRR